MRKVKREEFVVARTMLDTDGKPALDKDGKPVLIVVFIGHLRCLTSSFVGGGIVGYLNKIKEPGYLIINPEDEYLVGGDDNSDAGEY
jgi:hypothetical protein